MKTDTRYIWYDLSLKGIHQTCRTIIVGMMYDFLFCIFVFTCHILVSHVNSFVLNSKSTRVNHYVIKHNCCNDGFPPKVGCVCVVRWNQKQMAFTAAIKTRTYNCFVWSKFLIRVVFTWFV